MTWLFSEACRPPRITEFDEDDEQACLRDREEIARRLAHEQKLRAHPCPSDPEHPGEFQE